MKKKVLLTICAMMLCFGLTGCGIVTVVPVGQEASFTGKQEFDSSAQSGDDWGIIVEKIKTGAQDFKDAVGAGLGDGTAVKGSAKIIKFNTDTPKYVLEVEVDGIDKEITIQAGGVYSGTILRDTQTLKEFGSFTNQTEWSQYAKALNKEVDAQVVAPLNIDDSVAGKTVTFCGAASENAGKIVITPVELTIE